MVDTEKAHNILEFSIPNPSSWSSGQVDFMISSWQLHNNHGAYERVYRL